MTKYNWEEIIKDYQNSGMSKHSYCLKHNLSDTTLTRNMAKLHIQEKQAAGNAKKDTAIQKNVVPAPVFIPLEVEPGSLGQNKTKIPDNSSITISYRDFKIDVSETTDTKLLQSVLKVLQSC